MSENLESSRTARLEALNLAGRVASTASVLMHAAIADRLGLGPADSKAYDVLLREGPLTAGQLGARTGLTSGSVTALVDRLEKGGFAQRSHDDVDRRRVFIHARPERLSDAMALLGDFVAGVEVLNAGYSDDELALLQTYMEKVAALAQAALARLNVGKD